MTHGLLHEVTDAQTLVRRENVNRKQTRASNLKTAAAFKVSAARRPGHVWGGRGRYRGAVGCSGGQREEAGGIGGPYSVVMFPPQLHSRPHLAST